MQYSLSMAEGYSWNYARGRDRNKLPGPEHLGWWAGLALILSICLHIAIYFLLERMEIAWSFQQARDLSTASVDFRQVEIRSMPETETLEPEDHLAPVPDNSASLLEEIDLLAALPKDEEIDVSTEIDEASFALQMNQPDVGGQAPVARMDPAAGIDIHAMLPEMGSEPALLPPAEVGQVVIDSGATPGVEDGEGLAQQILKAGEGEGRHEGIASLENLLDLPPNLLLSSKTRLPSDLLFEFNSAELRESARLGLMKLALLLDRNPGLYCWIEGHTDLIGGDAFNLKLSRDRADAVKSFLVDSMRMDPERIIARGFGRSQPIVRDGDAAAQAPNRRVEIRMRKTPPSAASQGAAAPEGTVASPPRAEPAPPPRAVLIKPRRALPVDEPEAAPAGHDLEVPVARPVTEPQAPPEPPRARPVIPESPPRAAPVSPERPSVE